MYVLVEHVEYGSIKLYGPFVSQAGAWEAWKYIGKEGFVYSVAKIHSPVKED